MPISETQIFTARVTYTTCTGNPIIVEDDITVTVEEPPFNVESIVEIEEDDELLEEELFYRDIVYNEF